MKIELTKKHLETILHLLNRAYSESDLTWEEKYVNDDAAKKIREKHGVLSTDLIYPPEWEGEVQGALIRISEALKNS